MFFCDEGVGATTTVCRDKQGCYLGAPAVIFDGLVDPACLETHACNEALSLVQDLHLRQVVVGSDYLEVVTNINRGAATIYAHF